MIHVIFKILLFYFLFFIVTSELYAQNLQATDDKTTICRDEILTIYLDQEGSQVDERRWFWSAEGFSNPFNTSNDTINISRNDFPQNQTSAELNLNVNFVSGNISVFSITLSIGSPPQVELGPDNINICPGETVTLQDNNNPSPDDIWSTGDTAASINAGAGTYTLIKSEDGCSSTDQVTVNETTPPRISLSADSAICRGDTTELVMNIHNLGTITPGNNPIYEWIPEYNIITNPSNSIVEARPETDTTYTAVITDNEGCTDTARTYINVKQPRLETNFTDTLMCSSDTAFIALSPEGGTPYQNQPYYETGITPQNNVIRETDSGFYVSPDSTTLYTVYVSDAMGCRAPENIQINVHELSAEIIQAPEYTFCLSRDSMQLETRVNGDNLPYTYKWQQNTANISDNEVSEPYIYAGNAGTSMHHTFNVTDAMGCKATDSIRVYFRQLPQFSVQPETLRVCNNAGARFETSANDTGRYTYSWTPAHAAIDSLNINNPYIDGSKLDSLQKFTVHATDTKGCRSTETSVWAQPLTMPSAQGIVSSDTTTPDSTITFTHQSTNTDNFTWEFGDGSSTQNTNPVQHTYQQPGQYNAILNAANQNGCTDKDTISIVIERTFKDNHVLYIPTAFKPESNNTENQHLKVYGENIAETAFTFRVINKWGETVYETHSFEKANQTGWNGKYQNTDTPQQADVYTWIARGRFLDGKTFEKSGTVTLIR